MFDRARKSLNVRRALQCSFVGGLLVVVGGCTTGLGLDGGDGPIQCVEDSSAASIQSGPTRAGYEPFSDGAQLLSWARPQGGFGTRINVLLTGATEDTEFEQLRIQAFDAVTDEQIADNPTGQFPTECQAEGLIVEEIPVRFANGVVLEAVDGKTIRLVVSAASAAVGDHSHEIELVVKAGEFIEPSWWDE